MSFFLLINWNRKFQLLHSENHAARFSSNITLQCIVLISPIGRVSNVLKRGWMRSLVQWMWTRSVSTTYSPSTVDVSSCCHCHCDRSRAPMLSTAFSLLLIVSRYRYIDKYDSRGLADIQLARVLCSRQIDKQEAINKSIPNCHCRTSFLSLDR